MNRFQACVTNLDLIRSGENHLAAVRREAGVFHAAILDPMCHRASKPSIPDCHALPVGDQDLPGVDTEFHVPRTC